MSIVGLLGHDFALGLGLCTICGAYDFLHLIRSSCDVNEWFSSEGDTMFRKVGELSLPRLT